MSPSLVVSVWGVWVLVVVGGLHGQLGVIRLMRIKLDFPLHGCKMLSVNLVGKMPEYTLPDKISLTILKPQNVFIIGALGDCHPVKTRNIGPEADHAESADERPALEPTFRVNIVECPIGVTLKRSRNWETMGSILLSEDTKSIDNVWHFF